MQILILGLSVFLPQTSKQLAPQPGAKARFSDTMTLPPLFRFLNTCNVLTHEPAALLYCHHMVPANTRKINDKFSSYRQEGLSLQTNVVWTQTTRKKKCIPVVVELDSTPVQIQYFQTPTPRDEQWENQRDAAYIVFGSHPDVLILLSSVFVVPPGIFNSLETN